MGEIVVAIVDMLLDLSTDKGVRGVVATVERLLLLMLLPAEEPPDELLVLELNFRILLNAPTLEAGGLDANIEGEES